MTVALYLDAGEPDAATSCKSGSEGGDWKSAHWVTRWPPTLLDAIYFLDLPDQEEKQTIWQIYLTRFELDAKQELPDDNSWTGAEIRACCRLAALLDVPLVEAARNIVPVSVTAAESVERLRSWASGRCLDAAQPGIYQAQSASAKKRKRRVQRNPSNN